MTPADVQLIALLMQQQLPAEKKATVELLSEHVRLLRRRVAAEHARLDFAEKFLAENPEANDAVKLMATHLPLDGEEAFIERLRIVNDLIKREHSPADPALPVPTRDLVPLPAAATDPVRPAFVEPQVNVAKPAVRRPITPRQ